MLKILMMWYTEPFIYVKEERRKKLYLGCVRSIVEKANSHKCSRLKEKQRKEIRSHYTRTYRWRAKEWNKKLCKYTEKDIWRSCEAKGKYFKIKKEFLLWVTKVVEQEVNARIYFPFDVSEGKSSAEISCECCWVERRKKWNKKKHEIEVFARDTREPVLRALEYLEESFLCWG